MLTWFVQQNKQPRNDFSHTRIPIDVQCFVNIVSAKPALKSVSTRIATMFLCISFRKSAIIIFADFHTSRFLVKNLYAVRIASFQCS